jgi:hypothetical protein
VEKGRRGDCEMGYSFDRSVNFFTRLGGVDRRQDTLPLVIINNRLGVLVESC